MFQILSDQCFIDVVNVLCARIYIPDETIALVGEKGLEMYFLVRGECAVLHTDNAVVCIAAHL